LDYTATFEANNHNYNYKNLKIGKSVLYSEEIKVVGGEIIE